MPNTSAAPRRCFRMGWRTTAQNPEPHAQTPERVAILAENRRMTPDLARLRREREASTGEAEERQTQEQRQTQLQEPPVAADAGDAARREVHHEVCATRRSDHVEGVRACSRHHPRHLAREEVTLE